MQDQEEEEGDPVWPEPQSSGMPLQGPSEVRQLQPKTRQSTGAEGVQPDELTFSEEHPDPREEEAQFNKSEKLFFLY